MARPRMQWVTLLKRVRESAHPCRTSERVSKDIVSAQLTQNFVLMDAYYHLTFFRSLRGHTTNIFHVLVNHTPFHSIPGVWLPWSSLRVLKAIDANYKTVPWCVIYLAVTLSAPRTQNNLTQDVSFCHARCTGPCVPAPCNDQPPVSLGLIIKWI